MSDKPILRIPMSEEEFDAKLLELCEQLWPKIEHLSEEEQERFIYECITDPNFLREHFGAELDH